MPFNINQIDKNKLKLLKHFVKYVQSVNNTVNVLISFVINEEIEHNDVNDGLFDIQ